MDINAWELPFRSPLLSESIEHTRAITIATSDPNDLTVCLNADATDGERWEKEGSIELRWEAIVVHETIHALLRMLIGAEADRSLDGSRSYPIDRWDNDYAISRPVGMSYYGTPGFWRREW